MVARPGVLQIAGPLIFSLTVPLFAADNTGVSTQDRGAAAPQDAVIVYRMRGDVRLLVIWLGKDDVGGGRITIKRPGNPPAASWNEEFEVLFGSNPDRVPGKINRWGYGREIAEWQPANGGSSPSLIGTRFEGFMSRSDEGSIAQAKQESQKAAANSQFRFAATDSKVSTSEASSEIRHFTTPEPFDYRQPERLRSHYQANIAQTPPNKKEALINRPPVYELPYGFLSGVAELIREVTEAAAKKPNTREATKPKLTYVYNAKPYRLEVLRIQDDEDFHLPAQPASTQIPRVTRIQFRSTNIVKDTHTDFDLWIPLSGEYKNIPLRIQFQPRWWLRLRLDVDLQNSHPAASSLQNTSAESTRKP
jgi:hypothetical protein